MRIFTILVSLIFLIGAARSQTHPTTAPINPDLPTLWIIGDSTVRNGQDTGNNGQWGWGNPIAAYFDTDRINVQNWALGGTSSRTFQTIGRWDKVFAQIKPGDFLIMQFGHNDSGAVNDTLRARATLKGNGDETQEIDNMLTHKHEVVHTYGWYIRKYIGDAKEHQAAAIIVCSPIPRNRWSNDKVDRNTTYTEWAKQAADQAGAAFIDLNAIVSKKYDELGQQRVTDTLFPENETVHPDWAGAVMNAECVIDGLESLDKSPLIQYLRSDPPKDLQPPSGKAR